MPSHSPLRRSPPALRFLLALHLLAFSAATALGPARGMRMAPDVSVLLDDHDPLAAALSPVVYLHPSEQLLPSDPLVFLAGSRLVWAHDDSCRDHLVAGHIDPHRLGAGGYQHRESERALLHCDHDGHAIGSNSNARPRTREVGEEGFFLDLQQRQVRAGIGVTAPVLYYHVPGRYIVYWFFYAYNDGGPFDHEGDWENITVHLDAQDRPTEVAFFAHGRPRVYPWDGIDREGSHPVVYSAKGSHASYARPGFHLAIPGFDSTSAGPKWRTWRHLRNVVREDWWGYGGAWGEVGEIAATTGPQGPSPYKIGLPLEWWDAAVAAN